MQLFDSDDVGRSALKVENVSLAWSTLRENVMSNRCKIDTYVNLRGRGPDYKYSREGIGDPFTVSTGVQLGKVKLEPAKDIESDRLSFPNKPSINPENIFDKETLAAFRDPDLLQLRGIDEDARETMLHTSGPGVKVRGSVDEQMKLF